MPPGSVPPSIALLATCFLPARCTVSMSSVSKTGRWKHTVHAYLWGRQGQSGQETWVHVGRHARLLSGAFIPITTASSPMQHSPWDSLRPTLVFTWEEKAGAQRPQREENLVS